MNSPDSLAQDPSIPSAITVPSQRAPTSAEGLLLKLLEACAKHKRHHESTDNNESATDDIGEMSKKCSHELSSLAKILPRMEETITVVDTMWDSYVDVGTTAGSNNSSPEKRSKTAKKERISFENEDVKHLCALYRAIARSAFCPHAATFLFRDEEIIPRVVRLIGFLIRDPTGASEGEMAEEIGSIIAELLRVLDTNLQTKALQDLICLANDLNTVQEAAVLFDPMNNGSRNNESERRIRIQIFPQLTPNTKIEIVSQRSLLSLQLGIWLTLKQFIPKEDDGYVGRLSIGNNIGRVDMFNQIIAAARPILLYENSNDERGGWVYAENDSTLHSSLILHTKIVISDLLVSIASDSNLSAVSISFSAHPEVLTSQHVVLALLSIEAAKVHLRWNHSHTTADSLDEKLNLQCARSIAKLMLSVLFTDGVWSHSLSYLVDALPCLANQRQPLLPRVVLRILLAYLSKHVEAASLFHRRCLAHGYFLHLFQLAADPSETVASASIAIIIFEMERTADDIQKHISSIDFSSSLLDDGMQEEEEQYSIQHGNKRRRILDGRTNSMQGVNGEPLHSTLVHYVVDAVAKAASLVVSMDKKRKSCSPKRGAKALPPILQEDLSKLRSVTGILLILISLRSFSPLDWDAGSAEAIQSLFRCVQQVSRTLASHEREEICLPEANVLEQTLSLVATVGYHAYQLDQTDRRPNYRAERESITHCVTTALPLISPVSREIDNHATLEFRAPTKQDCCCQNTCARLCSLIGATAAPSSDICLCGIEHKTLPSMVNCVLPLRFRCIMLAALSPIAADSNQVDTTLTSIQRILAADSSRSNDDVTTSALVSLPTLLLSLAAFKEDTSSSTRYLISLMESFDIDLITRHCQSEVTNSQVAAFLTLARLNEMYAAASVVIASKDTPNVNDHLRSNAIAFLWDTLNPSVSGIDSVLLSMIPIDESSGQMTDSLETDLPPSLTAPFESYHYTLPLLQQDHRVFLAAHAHLRSVLSTLPRSKLQSSGVYKFLSDRKHYLYFDRIAHATHHKTECKKDTLKSLPWTVWVLLAPFLAPEPMANRVARNVAITLLGNQCKVLYSLFTLDVPGAIETAPSNVANMFFRELEYLFIRFYNLPQDLILIGDGGSNQEGELDEHGLDIAVCLLQSLYQAAPVDSAIGVQVLQQSLLRLIRIWVGGLSTKYNDDSAGSPFSAAGDAVKHSFANREQLVDLLKCGKFAKAVLREFFLPPTKDSSIPWSRYQLLVEFFEACLIPYARTQGLPIVDVPNNVEVAGVIDKLYPAVITSMIFDQDMAGLEMCAAFRMYVVNENKTQLKKQKKSSSEVIAGKHQKKDRPASFDRDLVAGVKLGGSAVSAKGLTDNMKMLCWKSHIIEHVLPKLLLHSDRSVLKFFATELCPPNTSLSQILREKEQTVLKALVWELGGDDPDEDNEHEIYGTPSIEIVENSYRRGRVVLALKMGYLIKEEQVIASASENSAEAFDDTAAGHWIGSNFLYLLVNVVLYRWKSRSEQEQWQTIKCLKALLRYLPSGDSLKFMPQIMVAISNAMGSNETSLRFLAVSTLFDFVKVLAGDQLSNVEDHLTSLVVILFPLFEEKVPRDDVARHEAVNLLLWLAEHVCSGFSEIPFLPMTPDLQALRDLLAAKGVAVDDIKLISQNDETFDANHLKSKFYSQMNILSDLIANHENKEVRKVVIQHMTKLIRSNRALFDNMIDNEALASMHFLTVVHDDGGKEDVEDSVNGGFITKLLMRLLSKCVDESDRDIRDALACCLGEIGAIDCNRLGQEINSSQFSTDNDSDDWRLNQPPWNSDLAQYQLRLVTQHLVWALRAAPAIIDQHKIGFGIQELLKQLDHAHAVDTAEISDHIRKEMSSWLKEKLDEADVRCVLEPFWTSDYQQQDISAEKKPPYFVKSNSYFRWLSSFCRYLVTKSHSNENSLWRDTFYACRSAIRSQAGVGVAEFILPLLVIDAVCFGEMSDQDVVINEFLAALSFDDEMGSSMSLKERENAVNTVFTIIEVIRTWTEREMERVSKSPPKKSKRRSRKDDIVVCSSWPVEESISKATHFLKRIPLAACSLAASAVGMNARALRFLEIESRSKCGMHIKIPHDLTDGPKYLRSEYLEGIDLGLTRKLLGKLSDFDTMVLISRKNHLRESSLTIRLKEEASERELCGDIEGSCQVYEQLLDARLNIEAEPETKADAQQGLLRCLLKLGRLDSVINQAQGMSNSGGSGKSVIYDDFLPSASEAAWRLGNWSVLDQVSEVHPNTITDANDRHQLCLGRVMHSLHKKSHPEFTLALQEAREVVMTSLSSAARDSYSQSYPHIMQLQALREVEQTSRGWFKRSSHESNTILCNEWTHRLSMSSPASSVSNVIMDTRLALCRMTDQPMAEGLLWLEIGKRARKGGLFQVSEQCLTHADAAFCSLSSSTAAPALAQESVGKVKLQLAKLKYALGETTTALNLIENDVPSSIFHLEGRDLQACVSRSGRSVDNIGRLLLQATEWIASDRLKSVSEIRSRYQTVLRLVPKWERAHFHFGKYLDTLYENSIVKNTVQSDHDSNASRANAIASDEKSQRLLIEAINHYGTALQLGQKHVFQALPRLLAMWTEFTAIVPEQSANLPKHQSEVNKLIKSFISKIPEHLFYTALPQLVSCILHSNKDTSRNVKQILTAVLAKYPCQTMWSCNWLRFSKLEGKQKAGNDIFDGAKKLLLQMEGGEQLQGMLDASKDLYRFLLQLAKYSPDNSATTSVRMKAPKFPVHLTSFIPPIQSALSVTPGALDRSDVNEVFPQFVPKMRGFNPEIKFMQSKAKPKRIGMFAVPTTKVDQVNVLLQKEAKRSGNVPEIDCSGFDTGEMHFLVKQEAKGDLRKDSRVQDLNNVINRLFAARKASSGADRRRQRLRLHLRTFSVVCLSEDCGILEWVPSTDSFRSLIGATYNPQVPPTSKYRRGDRITNYNNVELRDAFMKCQDMYIKKGNLKGAAERFDKTVLQEYLPFMYWWFVQNFPNPHAWFEARNNFTLSTAVWSAVGHIIGLGDRHSENILIDTRSGECVHVDFDCIFDKGLLLPRPEVIPFRLTPNMIDAFGPTGADGLFTGALIESMKTLRTNRDTLLSVLEPFLNDPVINFSSSKNQQKAQTASAKAADAMRKIDGRLKGMYNLTNPNFKKITRRDGVAQEDDDSSHVALSVEGQVQRMISEATSHENLVQVYVGWMPWI